MTSPRRQQYAGRVVSQNTAAAAARAFSASAATGSVFENGVSIAQGFTMSGAAEPGFDYRMNRGSSVGPEVAVGSDGSGSVQLTMSGTTVLVVTPLADAGAEVAEGMTITLAAPPPKSGATLGTAAAAIATNSGVTLTAEDVTITTAGGNREAGGTVRASDGLSRSVYKIKVTPTGGGGQAADITLEAQEPEAAGLTLLKFKYQNPTLPPPTRTYSVEIYDQGDPSISTTITVTVN